MKQPRIAWKNMPPRPVGAIWSAAVVWLYVDRYETPQWLIGALALFFLLIFAAGCISAVNSKSVDIFDKTP